MARESPESCTTPSSDINAQEHRAEAISNGLARTDGRWVGSCVSHTHNSWAHGIGKAHLSLW
eukprot:14158172-Alexandrium_andersonii.AAC.1